MKEGKGAGPAGPAATDDAHAALRSTVAELVRGHDARAEWLRALDDRLCTVRADLLVYPAAPRR